MHGNNVNGENNVDDTGILFILFNIVIYFDDEIYFIFFLISFLIIFFFFLRMIDENFLK